MYNSILHILKKYDINLITIMNTNYVNVNKNFTTVFNITIINFRVKKNKSYIIM